jgi:hypothetical protein
MREVRYTGNPTPMVFISSLLSVYSGWCAYQLTYSIIVFNPPTSTTVIKLLLWLVGFGYSLFELINWALRRNAIAFKLGAEAVWIEKLGWLSCQVVNLKVDRWRDVVSISYETPAGTYLETWPLSDLSIRSDELIAFREGIADN